MPGTLGPNLGLTWGWVPHESGWGVNGFNPGFALLDTTVHLAVLDRMNDPPITTPAEGDRYIVGPVGTGAWSAASNQIAVFVGAAWVFHTAKAGWHAWNVASGTFWLFDTGAWVERIVADERFTFTAPANNDVVVYDTTAAKFINVRPLRGLGFGLGPSALLTADQPVFYHRLAFGLTIPADFVAYRGALTALGATAAATADTVFRVQKAVAASPLSFFTVGTLTIGLGTVNLTDADSSAAAVVFAQNDVVRILAPTVPDATLTGVYGTLIGYET